MSILPLNLVRAEAFSGGIFDCVSLTPGAFTGRDPSDTNTVGGRPDRIGNGNLPKGERTIGRWFDASTLVAPPVDAGRFGNAGLGVLEDLGADKAESVTYLSPEFDDPRRLDFSEKSGRVSFAVPDTRLYAMIVVRCQS
jgi:hypothetical protein